MTSLRSGVLRSSESRSKTCSFLPLTETRIMAGCCYCQSSALALMILRNFASSAGESCTSSQLRSSSSSSVCTARLSLGTASLARAYSSSHYTSSQRISRSLT